MSPTTTLPFPFPSLDFPERATLTPVQIASRLGLAEKHIRDLINEGEIPAVDGKGKGTKRGSYRVPTESYRDFVLVRMTGPRRMDLLCQLPKPVLRELVRELTAFLKS
ncbi:MAG: helix-turn-helix domain-containing protein [Verrucomicrobiota bacterium]